jgi:tetratricopeptide (TPR) repeat protein
VSSFLAPPRRLASAAGLLLCLAFSCGDLRAQQAPLDALLASYRRGDVEPARRGLTELMAADDAPRKTAGWIQDAVRQRRTADLEAALLLYSESIMVSWSSMPGRMSAVKACLEPMRRIHQALRDIKPVSSFLRAWYLAWESFQQAHAFPILPDGMDYLGAALDAFPDDAQILLAAGSRAELEWWISFENAHRDPRGEPGIVTRYLQLARGFLRRSIAASADESEARLRLARVLLQLGDLDGADSTLRGYDWTAHGPAFEYLTRLFEGDLHERRGNSAAAAKSYDAAISLVGASQSARIAKARLSYAEGLRAEAADMVEKAMDGPLTESDPWWWYVRGQAWRFEIYLKNANAMVRRQP